MEPLNNVDVIILIGIALSMLVAFIRGFVKEVLSILGLILFIAISFYLSPQLLPWMNQYINSQMLCYVVIVLIIMAVFYALWIISTDKLIAKIRTSTLSFMDRLFGLLFGFLRAVLILGFCFLVVKITLPEELKDGPLKESKYFMMASVPSDFIEKLLPEKLIQNTVKSVGDMNKVEKKKNENKEKVKTKKSTKPKKDPLPVIEKLPSELDQKQMNEMFEKLVKPDVKTEKKAGSFKKESKNITGYDSKETKSLDRLIDITAE